MSLAPGTLVEASAVSPVPMRKLRRSIIGLLTMLRSVILVPFSSHQTRFKINESEMAEASGSRTHRRQENLPPDGFEDHQECSDWL